MGLTAHFAFAKPASAGFLSVRKKAGKRGRLKKDLSLHPATAAFAAGKIKRPRPKNPDRNLDDLNLLYYTFKVGRRRVKTCRRFVLFADDKGFVPEEINMTNRKQGFTLVELLVVVLIIGILAAMALPAYFQAVERSRISEAETMMGNIAQAQQRALMKNGKYAAKFSGLDVSPTTVATSVFCTKGGTVADGTADACDGNGFAISLDTTNVSSNTASAVVTAKRKGNARYDYTLTRYYQGNKVQCDAGAGDTADEDKALCAEYCGLDDPTAQCCNDGTDGECPEPTL